MGTNRGFFAEGFTSALPILFEPFRRLLLEKCGSIQYSPSNAVQN